MNKKNFKFYLLILIGITVILSACTKYDAMPLVADDRMLSEVITADDGNEVMTVEVHYPIMNGGGFESVVDKLNKEFSEAAENEFNQIISTYSDEAVNSYNDGFMTLAYEFKTDWEIRNRVGDVMSILFTHYQDTGGAHGGTLQDSYTYDITTGNILSAEDIVGGTHEEIIAKAKEAFIKIINESPDDYSINAIDTVNAADDIKFYLHDENHLAFYFNEYEIAPYVAGIQTVLINFSEK